MPTRREYKQQLPAIGLSLERYTTSVPQDGAYYLVQHGQQLGRYRSLKAAKVAWDEAVGASGWTPTRRALDVADVALRERRERWARNRAG
jgi:hypothetical protein